MAEITEKEINNIFGDAVIDINKQPTEQSQDNTQQPVEQPIDDQTINQLFGDQVQELPSEQQQESSAGIIDTGKSISKNILGAQETVINMAGMLGSEIAAGLTGIGALIANSGDLDKTVNAIESVKKAGAELFAPKLDKTKDITEAIGKGVELVNEELIKPSMRTGAKLNPLLSDEDRDRLISLIDEQGIDALGEFTSEKTNSPLLGTLVKTSPTALGLILPASKSLATAKLKPLVDATGKLEPTFERALFDRGISQDLLVDAAKAKLPQISNTTGLTQARAAKKAAEEIVKLQLENKSNAAGLAPVKLSKGKVVDDLIAQEAAKQGFDNGTIQMVKNANSATKKAMNKALRIAYNSSLDRGILKRTRPSDVAGEALTDRIKFIRNKANQARIQLDKIAEKELKGVQLNPDKLRQTLNKTFEELDIEDLNPKGIPNPNFKGSQISGDKGSQKTIKEMIRIMSESKQSDALAWHKMKRQFDRLINYRRDKQGLGVDGEKAIKDMRSTINTELRNFSQNYANTNDILSKALSGFEELQDAVGRSINIFDKNADTALGTAVKNIFSNNTKRQKLETAFDNIDNLANDLGGKFNTDYANIYLFTKDIEPIFGISAPTSLAGETSTAIKTSLKDIAIKQAEKAVEKGLEKVRDINTLNAFKSMDQLTKGRK